MDTSFEHATPPAPPALTALPEDRSRWPEDAGRAFARLLWELDLWSRQHGWPATANARVAEEGVRRAWQPEA